jgi:hypothetical protein
MAESAVFQALAGACQGQITPAELEHQLSM